MKKEYIEISSAEKLALLQKHSIGAKWENLEDTKWCLHCESQFTGHSARVYKDHDPGLWLECGTEGCNGSPIDWAEYPWWDENHPMSRAADAEMEKLEEETARSRKVKS